jgi:murein DD-endopeptidase MepM/ murein hydrolase activator NlpD
MDKRYSILILTSRDARVRRLVFTQRSMRAALYGATLLMMLGGWLFADHLWLKFQGGKEAQAQRELMTHLEGQTQSIQKLLGNWKGFQERIRASLPSQRKASFDGHQSVEELERTLGSLQEELQRLIASVPSEMPAEGQVSSGIGMRQNPWTGKPEFHSGIDIPKPIGTPVYAPGDAVVDWAGPSDGNGNAVILNHGQGITTQYLHLSKIEVKKGDQVRKGERIAQSGNTGKSTSPHLHYEVRVNGVPIDPRQNLIK